MTAEQMIIQGLREEQRRSGMTDSRFASALGINRSTWCRLNKGPEASGRIRLGPGLAMTIGRKYERLAMYVKWYIEQEYPARQLERHARMRGGRVVSTEANGRVAGGLEAAE